MFASLFKAFGGDTGDRSPWGGFWFNPVPFKGGRSLNGDTALQLTAVYSCVRIAAETFASLPAVVYKQKSDNTRSILPDHWLSILLNRRPNRWQTPFEFREMLQGHLELRGNAFADPVGNDHTGEVSELIPIHPDRVQVEYVTDDDWRYVIRNRDGTYTYRARGELLHVKGLSPDGVLGYNPCHIARVALSSAIAAQDSNMHFYQNDARPTGIIEMPGQMKDDEQRRLFRNRWQEQQTGRNRHKTAILEFGMQYKEIGLTRQDAQFIEDRKFSRAEIAGMWRIPPHMIADLDKATFSNIEQQDIDFVKHSMKPRTARWESALQYWFLTDDNIHVEFPMWELMRGDAASRTMYYQAGINVGFLTRNEVRAMEHLNPIEGLDEPLRPLNMTPNSAPVESGTDNPNNHNEE